MIRYETCSKSTQPIRLWLLALLLIGLLAALPSAAQAQRVALVVGNASYTDRPLRNPVNDAVLMQTTLSNLGFQVSVVRNADRKALLAGLRDFEAKARNADVALFFYAGHGAQVGGSNYLIPLNAQINAEADVPDEAVDAASVLRRIEDARAKVGLVILDACRDNPYTGSSRSGARGLARMNVPTGTIVAYATAPGSTADDGTGRSNGIYTEQLARHLAQPGLDIKDVFDRTAQEVERITAGKQRPREEIGLRGRYVLREGGQQVATARVEPVPQPAPISAPQPQPAPPATTQPILRAGQTFKDCDVCPEMVVIPAGSFTMGSSASEQALVKEEVGSNNKHSSESPQRRVSMPSFAAGRYAVTKGEFAAFVRSSNYQTKAERSGGCFVWTGSNWEQQADKNWRNVGFAQGDEHPVVCVSWNDAQEFAKWVSQQSGKSYRLLSEAEREYAARAGTQTAFWWGSSLITNVANFDGNSRYNGSPRGIYRRATVPVSSFSSNPFGLYNVHGNVWEWVQDCWHDNYIGAPTDGSAWMTDCAGPNRVVRGGSWFSPQVTVRSANRDGEDPETRDSQTGFRLARTP